jgi:hypothetical protein
MSTPVPVAVTVSVLNSSVVVPRTGISGHRFHHYRVIP